MANYPSAAPSFTSKSAGQTIAPGHINDLQDEVAAIGGDLVGGTIQHDLTPQTNSTRDLGSASARWKAIYGTSGAFDRVESTSLSVTGNSTVANLHVTNESTMSTVTITRLTVTNLQVTGGSSGTSPGADAARIWTSSNSTVGGASTLTHTVLSFDTILAQSTATFHSTTTNPTRLTVPSSGWYVVSGNVRTKGQEASTHVIQEVGLEIVRDSTHVIASQRFGAFQQLVEGTTNHIDLNVHTIGYFPASTSFVELRHVFHAKDSTGTVIILSVSSLSPVFAMAKL